MTDIRDLIQEANLNPPKPVIEGLLHESETAGLHGPPEVFKTIFCLQLAEALATGTALLNVWPVPRPVTVYFFESEMSMPALGKRLAAMFRNRSVPGNVYFADEARLRQFKRAPNLQEKFKLLSEWVKETKAEVLILDTCNPFFRGKESPNDETTVGMFFDLLEAIPASTKLFVRHNHKRKLEDAGTDASARIRGSGQFSDVPDLLVELRRTDKRTQEAELAVTKFRHGTKPDDLALWFDSGSFRLTALPPVIYLLQAGPLSRADLLASLEGRFGVGQRRADQMVADLRPFLLEGQDGHKRIVEIDSREAKGASWYRLLEPRFPRGEGVQDMQGCISSPLSLSVPSSPPPQLQ